MSQKDFSKKLLNLYEKTCLGYAKSKNSYEFFSQILNNILELTESEYGFIGRVLYKNSKPYLKTIAITDVAWNEETLKMYHDSVEDGLEFYNMETLFGKVILSERLLITNDPANEPGANGLPDGHPPLKSFMGIPLHFENNLIGMVGIANRSNGFSRSLYDSIRVFFDLCAKLIDSYHNSPLQQTGKETVDSLDTNTVESIYNTIVDSVIVINSLGEIKFFNDSATKMFGYGRQEVVGKNVSVLMPQPYKNFHNKYIQDYLETRENKIIGTTRELVAVKKNGESFSMELSVNPFRDQDEECFIGVIRDISERKKIDKIKEDLISVVSHELRTPITSIRGSLGLLSAKESNLGELSDKAKSLVNVARSNCERLVRLLNDLLDIEKIKSGKINLKFQRENLCTVIEQSISQNKGYAETYQVTLVNKCPKEDLSVLCDADRMNQAITNLLSNAIKFSNPGGNVDISVSDYGDQYVINIQDYGEGISKEYQKHIFNAFTQADSSSTRQKDGTGLGLTITKNIIEYHNGEIGLDSEEGKGTCFHFSIPKYIEIAVDAKRKHEENALLIAESNQEVLLVLKYLIDKTGFTSRYVINMQLLKRELNSVRYAAVIIDCDLLFETVEELLDEIRGTTELKTMPIILICEVETAKIIRVQKKDPYVLAVIEKPIDENILSDYLLSVKNNQ